jgi:hypothetical protein
LTPGGTVGNTGRADAADSAQVDYTSEGSADSGAPRCSLRFLPTGRSLLLSLGKRRARLRTRFPDGIQCDWVESDWWRAIRDLEWPIHGPGARSTCSRRPASQCRSTPRCVTNLWDRSRNVLALHLHHEIRWLHSGNRPSRMRFASSCAFDSIVLRRRVPAYC